jgi:hypothetical protein
MSTYHKKTAIRKSKKLEKPEKIKRAENLFVALAGLDTCLILHFTLISRLNMMEKYHKAPSEVKMVRPKKEDALKMYFTFYFKRKTPILGELEQ